MGLLLWSVLGEHLYLSSNPHVGLIGARDFRRCTQYLADPGGGDRSSDSVVAAEGTYTDNDEPVEAELVESVHRRSAHCETCNVEFDCSHKG